MLGARRFAATTGVTLHLNPKDDYARSDLQPLRDGDTVTVGHSTVRALHAPGHTPGSMLYEIDGRAPLTGDTLFVEGVGRPDLGDRAKAFAEELYTTYRTRLVSLADDLFVLPGHYGPDVRFAFREAIGATLRVSSSGSRCLGRRGTSSSPTSPRACPIDQRIPRR